MTPPKGSPPSPELQIVLPGKRNFVDVIKFRLSNREIPWFIQAGPI